MENTPPPSKEVNRERDQSSLFKLSYPLDGVCFKALPPEDRQAFASQRGEGACASAFQRLLNASNQF